MTLAEKAFAAGVAAFKAGIPLKACPPDCDTTEWRFGWETALQGKSNAFRDYVKARTMFEKKYLPPPWPQSRLPATQEWRQKQMDRLVAEYPDFPAAYAKYQESWK